MRKITLFVILLLMISGGLANHSFAEKRFTDLNENNGFYKEIQFLTEENIISGFPDGSFRPKSNVTRAQAAIMIGRAMGYDGKQRNTIFSDVNSNKVSSGYIAAAAENYLISGYPDGTFKPDKVVTRAEMAIILNRAFFDKNTTKSISFKDVGINMASYYPIRNLAAMGIVSGYTDGTFRPNNSLNREQFSAFLARAFSDDFVKSPDTDVSGYGKVMGSITWQYNDFIGTKSDTGANVFLIPSNFKYSSHGSLDLYSMLGSIPSNSNLHHAKVNGYGQYQIAEVPAGKYIIVISSKNTNRNLDEEVFLKGTLEPLLGKSNYETFELFNLKINKHTWKTIEIKKDKTIDISHDFGNTYF